MRKLWSTRKACLVIGASLATVLVVSLTVYGLAKRASCAFYGYSMGREVEYKAFVGCAVQTPAGWVLRSELRSVVN